MIHSLESLCCFVAFMSYSMLQFFKEIETREYIIVQILSIIKNPKTYINFSSYIYTIEYHQ